MEMVELVKIVGMVERVEMVEMGEMGELGGKEVQVGPRSTLNILVIFYWNFLLGGSHL